MNRDYIRQAQMIELRDFTSNLLARVETLREETNKYGGVRGRDMNRFFNDVEKLKEQRYFHNTEDK